MLMKMRYLGWGLLLISTSLFASTTLPSPAATPVEPLNGVVAVVNDDLITREAYDEALKAARAQAAERHMSIKDETTFKKQVLDQLIYQRLQLQMAKNNHITVSKKEVDGAIAGVIEHSGLSRQAFIKKLNATGVSYSVFCQQIKSQLITDKLQHQALASKMQVSDKDIAAFRKEHHLLNDQFEYHVVDTVVSLPDDPSQANLQKARAQAGALAAAFKSGAPADTADSNDLGWLTLESLPDLFASSVKTMKPGSVSAPIKAANGFHVLQLEGRRKNPKAVTNVQVKDFIIRKKFYTALKAWLTTLRDSAYVHINDDAYKA